MLRPYVGLQLSRKPLLESPLEHALAFHAQLTASSIWLLDIVSLICSHLLSSLAYRPLKPPRPKVAAAIIVTKVSTRSAGDKGCAAEMLNFLDVLLIASYESPGFDVHGSDSMLLANS